MIMCTIVKITLSVYIKILKLILVQRNQKLAELSGRYSCFCEAV